MLRNTVLALCCLLFGCAAPTVSTGYVLGMSKGKGLVIMSLSQVNSPQLSFPPIVVNYRRIGDSHPVGDGLIVGKGGLIIDGENWTRLHVFELEEGQYEFHKIWAGKPGTGMSYYANMPFSAQFTVKAGRATYAGMLEFQVSSSERYATRVADMRDRDIAIVLKERPLISKDKIDYLIFHGQ